MVHVKTMEINVVGRDGFVFPSLVVDNDSTVADLKKAFHQKNPKYAPSRQYFTSGTGPNRLVMKGDKSPLRKFGIEPHRSPVTLTFKDLGPQIAWRTVFFVEYMGPIMIHSLVWTCPGLFYSKPIEMRHPVQKIALALVIVHYTKRELESAFVHRFSNATMPIFNIFKNSIHYWGFGGLFIAYFLYHPNYSPLVSTPIAIALAIAFLICMFSNLYCHIILMNLRPPGTSVRDIPRSFLFELVSCPNYFFEILSWIIFSVLTGTVTAFLFAIISSYQMYIWAIAKHETYHREFITYPKSRKALIPYII